MIVVKIRTPRKSDNKIANGVIIKDDSSGDDDEMRLESPLSKEEDSIMLVSMSNDLRELSYHENSWTIGRLFLLELHLVFICSFDFSLESWIQEFSGFFRRILRIVRQSSCWSESSWEKAWVMSVRDCIWWLLVMTTSITRGMSSTSEPSVVVSFSKNWCKLFETLTRQC